MTTLPMLELTRNAVGKDGFLRASGIVFVGFSTARVLGFLFMVAAGHLLPGTEFGRLTYALTVAAILSALLSSSPIGMARFLALNRGQSSEQDSYFSNWVLVVALLLLASLAITPLAGGFLGLDGPLIVGLAANLVGVAVLETYREAQRGLNRYLMMGVFYVSANALQLIVILFLGRLDVRVASAYLIVYGLSSVAALFVLELISPLRLRFDLRLLDRRRVLQIMAFIAPLLVQSVFFVIWYGVDVIVVGEALGPAPTGDYGAAKTLGLALIMPTIAVATPLMPRVARLSPERLRQYLTRVIILTGGVALPLAGLGALFSGVVVELTFGDKYRHAADALPVIAVGMVAFGFHHILSSLWVGRGKPLIALVSTGGGMLVSMVLAVLWVRPFGLLGAGAAFSSGSVVRTLIIGGYTVFHLVLRPMPEPATPAPPPSPGLKPQQS